MLAPFVYQISGHVVLSHQFGNRCPWSKACSQYLLARLLPPSPMAVGAAHQRHLAHAVQLAVLIVTSLRAQHSHCVVTVQGGPRRRVTTDAECRSYLAFPEVGSVVKA